MKAKRRCMHGKRRSPFKLVGGDTTQAQYQYMQDQAARTDVKAAGFGWGNVASGSGGKHSATDKVDMWKHARDEYANKLRLAKNKEAASKAIEGMGGQRPTMPGTEII